MSEPRLWEIPIWLRKLGVASWFLVGIVIAVDMVGRIKVSGLFGDFTGEYVDEAPYALEEVGVEPDAEGQAAS
jgi:hypothetical protein